MDDNENKFKIIQGGLGKNQDENNTDESKNIDVDVDLSDNEELNNTDIENHSEDDNFESINNKEIGIIFDNLNEPVANYVDTMTQDNITKHKKHSYINILVTIMFIAVIVLCAYCITMDILESKEYLENTSYNNINIMYAEKPEIDEADYVDENGKYTYEGVASVVRPSIVEIYTYEDSNSKVAIGSGSGIILSSDGYIITNAHVLDSEGHHVVTTYDDKPYVAEIVGRDSKTDIAVLKISAAGLTQAVFGNSDDVVVGEEVMAIGNPVGLSGTVTNGIVSAVNRKIRAQSNAFEMNCIQTNADISPGNSGGALVNMYAQVVGITSSKYASTTYEGLGFAISINDAMPIIEELISNGYMGGRFRIGITLLPTDDETSRIMIEEELGQELPEDFYGVFIYEINEDADIANSGLEKNDFIVSLEGTDVCNYDELLDALSEFKPNDYVNAVCAHINSNGEIEYYDIEFMLMPDTSGDY